MGKYPRCKVCGYEHALSEPHRFPGSTKDGGGVGGSTVRRVAGRDKTEPSGDTPVVRGVGAEVPRPVPKAIITQVEANRKWRAKNKDAYRVYMRKYMRQRRSKGK